MRELALFAGAGGGILGGSLLGWRTVCAVEWTPYAAGVLMARQNDGWLRPFPIWDDVQTFDGRPWRGVVDVVSGGFPCQDISLAGKGAGIEGSRSGMWKQMDRIIGEVRPKFVYVENAAALTSRGLGTVLGDLAARGFDAEWCVLSAEQLGLPQRRERIWIVAARPDTDRLRPQGQWTPPPGARTKQQFEGLLQDQLRTAVPTGKSGGVVDVVAHRSHRLKAAGNGQVPRVAAAAFTALAAELTP